MKMINQEQNRIFPECTVPLSMQIAVATAAHLASSSNNETAHCAMLAASFCFFRIRPKYPTQLPKWRFLS
jgi:hypothetical protein